ncbi:hypothetical protein [Oricola sp.]|uniref:hypothetical protein n=1 Tax=Oricola sp. TaxID=1979950 RepID=UPI003BAC9ECD
MADIIELPVITSLPTDPARILDRAPRDMARVLVIGKTADGEFYFAASDPDGGTMLWDMERARYKLMQLVEASEDQGD